LIIYDNEHKPKTGNISKKYGKQLFVVVVPSHRHFWETRAGEV